MHNPLLTTNTLITHSSCSVAALLFLCGVAASPAAANSTTNFEEIVVTATKLGETTLHDTPLAVSVFADQYLSDMVVSDIRDLSLMTPGLTLAANANMAQIYIRGIGSNNVFAGSDPSATIHQDGVYLARPQSNFGNFVDVERVEVLRGPQGTLYGRNSVGGTINIVSKRPDLNELKAAGNFSLGNKDFYRAEGYVSVPLATDVAAMSLSVYKSDRDAFRKNISTGNDLDDEDIQSFRGQFLWQVSESTEIIFRGDYYEDNSSLYASSSAPIAPPPGNPPLAGTIIGDARKVALNAPATIDREAYGASMEINTSFGDAWTLKSLSAYRRNDNYITQDSDSTDIDTLRTLLWEDQEQYSQEFNLVGSFERTKLFLGAYYLKEKIDSKIEVQTRANGRSTIMVPDVDTDTWALFGQVNFDLTESFTLTAGARYTEETKDWFKTHGVFLTGTDTQISSINLPAERGKYSEFTPKFGVEFRPAENLMLYATVSRGFKSGGFNITATVPGGYDPEKMWSYEVGLNARHLGGRLSSRLSAFYYDYKDLQVQAFIVPGVTSITNAASANVSGVEAELFGNVTENFVLRANASYLDAEYDQYPEAPLGGGVVIDASGNRLNNAPKWSASILGEYTATFDWGLLRFTGEYGWQSRVYFSVANSLIHSQGDYGVANASVGYESPNGMFTLTVWGRNLFDKEYLRGTSSIYATAGGYGPIRTYGLRIGVRY